ncbi:HNH endonuclease, partial [bacterium]|nr:HNH endonuclease [bacterium]MBU1883360.1 HNH endonuclease [bacterium]
INDRYNSSTTDLLTTAGHEMSHAIDARARVATDETYADIYGSNLADYTNFALNYTDQGTLATTNSHNTGQVTSLPSVFNDNTYATNNAEFSSLDKGEGDNNPLLLIPLAVAAFEMYANTPENPDDVKTGPTEMINLMPGKLVVEAVPVAKGFFGKIADKLFGSGEKVKVPTINGRTPINSKYAGQTHPSGVQFNKQGFPDFSPYSKAEVNINGLTGNYVKDAAIANKVVGLKSTPEGYVWHHVENGNSMQLIPRDIHNVVRHTGGSAVIRNGGYD